MSRGTVRRATSREESQPIDSSLSERRWRRIAQQEEGCRRTRPVRPCSREQSNRHRSGDAGPTGAPSATRPMRDRRTYGGGCHRRRPCRLPPHRISWAGRPLRCRVSGNGDTCGGRGQPGQLAAACHGGRRDESRVADSGRGGRAIRSLRRRPGTAVLPAGRSHDRRGEHPGHFALAAAGLPRGDGPGGRANGGSRTGLGVAHPAVETARPHPRRGGCPRRTGCRAVRSSRCRPRSWPGPL